MPFARHINLITNHVYKKIMNPKIGSYIKGKDELPAWIKECVEKLISVENHTSADLVKNWSDGNN